MHEKFNAIVETITPEMAREYLKANVVNRKLNNRTVDLYVDQMVKGLWIMNGEAISFTIGGALVNGQHRLNAIIKYGKPVAFLVVRGCDENSFSTCDSGRNRTTGDVFSIKGINNNISMAAIVNKYFLFHYGYSVFSKVEAKTTHNNIGNHRNITKQEFLDEYYSSVYLYEKAIQLARACVNKVRLFSTSELGGLIVYLSKDKHHSFEVIESFCRMLFLNENICNSTIDVLREKIIQDRLSLNTMTSRYRSALIAKTWNAYITGKELKVLSWSEAKEGKIYFL